ncbi:hypothetical protein BGX23_003970 [Mortierella sp. AD031]|nr:hypothetical protein BGX23_003970 [Mortierella sp. AD031]KAG0216895.1 hypothetical protein BGX33_011925 [Mortierella sp. NVP41]
MPRIKGHSLEPLSKTSDDHLKHQKKLLPDHLVRLYKIVYTGSESRLSSGSWSKAIYYHGRGHCGCLTVRTVKEETDCEDDDEDDESVNTNDEAVDGERESESEEDDDDEGDEEEEEEKEEEVLVSIKASEWCGNTACATQGILNRGHKRRFIKRGAGHYFTSDAKVAKGYALQKIALSSDEYALYPIFVCQVRNKKVARFKYVENDHDILPCFLAVVRGA